MNPHIFCWLIAPCSDNSQLNMENVLIITALTFSIGTLFQSFVKAQTQAQVLTTHSVSEQHQEDDIWLIAFLILSGVVGLCYMIVNG